MLCLVPGSNQTHLPPLSSLYLCLCLYQTWWPRHCQTNTNANANANAITPMEHWSLEIYIYLCRLTAAKCSTVLLKKQAGIEAAACRRSSALSTTMRLILQSGVHKRGTGIVSSVQVQRVLHTHTRLPKPSETAASLVVRTAAADSCRTSSQFPLVKGTSPVREIAWIASSSSFPVRFLSLSVFSKTRSVFYQDISCEMLHHFLLLLLHVPIC